MLKTWREFSSKSSTSTLSKGVEDTSEEEIWLCSCCEKTMSKNFNSAHIVSLDCTKDCAHFKVEIIRAFKAETIVLNFPSLSPPQQTSMWCSDKWTTHYGKRDKRLHPFRRALLITCFITKMLVFKILEANTHKQGHKPHEKRTSLPNCY
jgi:hypothetical protein